jgi:putative SOS response-associated peptidase YedK
MPVCRSSCIRAITIAWLNDYDGTQPPLDLLRPYPYESEAMRITPANRLVGNVRNDGPEMLNSA